MAHSKKIVAVLVLALALCFSAAAPVLAQDDEEVKKLNEQLVMATLWMQASAEYRALCYQAFNLARMNLDAYLAAKKGGKPAAVVVGIDETVLDSTPYGAWLIDQGRADSIETWQAWMQAAEAVALPGAKDFLNYAKGKGVEVFYISNRNPAALMGTQKNLKAQGMPYADEKHLLLRGADTDKKQRRDQVAKDYNIVLFLGDNLNDFAEAFRNQDLPGRFAQTDQAKDEWGKKFILLPNPTYGDWEGAVYQGNLAASPAEKNEMRKSLLNIWNYR